MIPGARPSDSHVAAMEAELRRLWLGGRGPQRPELAGWTSWVIKPKKPRARKKGALR